MNPVELRAAAGLAGLYALRMLGMFLILPVFAVYAGRMPGGENHALVELALGAFGLTQALLQLPMGMWSDRIGRKHGDLPRTGAVSGRQPDLRGIEPYWLVDPGPCGSGRRRDLGCGDCAAGRPDPRRESYTRHGDDRRLDRDDFRRVAGAGASKSSPNGSACPAFSC